MGDSWSQSAELARGTTAYVASLGYNQHVARCDTCNWTGAPRRSLSLAIGQAVQHNEAEHNDGTMCRCGHPKSDHRDYESGNRACTWPDCPCTQFDGSPDA